MPYFQNDIRLSKKKIMKEWELKCIIGMRSSWLTVKNSAEGQTNSSLPKPCMRLLSLDILTMLLSLEIRELLKLSLNKMQSY